MSTLLERLVAADPEHFEQAISTEDSPRIMFYARDERNYSLNTSVACWVIAGFCLESMQKRWNEIKDQNSHTWPAEGSIWRESDMLRELFREREDGWLDVNPESIISAFCDWKESLKKVSV